MLKGKLENLTRVAAEKVFDHLQRREQSRKASEARRQKARLEKKKVRLNKLRQTVCGPDTSESVQLWMAVIGKRPRVEISEIYVLKEKGKGIFLSFVYRTKEDLADALAGTYWTKAMRLFSDKVHDDYDRTIPLPPWPDYWPLQPPPDAKKGGSCTRAFSRDWYYYYLDLENSRFFLAVGMTHDEFHAEIEAKLARNAQQTST